MARDAVLSFSGPDPQQVFGKQPVVEFCPGLPPVRLPDLIGPLRDPLRCRARSFRRRAKRNRHHPGSSSSLQRAI